MRQFWPLFKKELRAYFTSPIFYIVGAVFLALVGYFFVNGLLNYSQLGIKISVSQNKGGNFNPTTIIMKPLFNTMGTVFILLTPLITMRLLAEEKRAGTIEMLMTCPVSTTSVVMAKYLASWVVFTVIILLTGYMPFVLSYYSTVIWSQVIMGYIGVFLLGGAMMSVGLFCSSITDKQIIAAVLTIGILVVFLFIGGVLGAASPELTRFLRILSLFSHFDALTDGLLDLRDVFYLLSFTATMLFLSFRNLEASRWRG